MPLEIELLLAAWDNVKKNMHQPDPYDLDAPIMTDREAELFDKVEDVMRQVVLEYENFDDPFATFAEEADEVDVFAEYMDEADDDDSVATEELPAEEDVEEDEDALSPANIAADLIS